MLSKTKGIVIRTIKYGESSAISNILTQEFGLLGFHIQSAYKPKSKYNISYFQALNIVELSFNHKKNVQLYKLSDISCICSPQIQGFNKQVFYHLYCEILQQTIKSEEINTQLFEYLSEDAIPGLEEEPHFWQLPFVMLNILYQYGCAPNLNDYKNGYFLDIQNGVFVEECVEMKYALDAKSSQIIHEILNIGSNQIENDKKDRASVIQGLIRYFQLHIHQNFELKSMDVLSQVSLQTVAASP